MGEEAVFDFELEDVAVIDDVSHGVLR